MAEIKGSKGSPTIDMTPMVDLAFLLVTFFMLSANFRTDDIVVDTPSSIASNEIPKNMILVTIDKNGKVFFGFKANEKAKEEVLNQMSAKYKIGFSDKQVKEFKKIASIGCPIEQLPQYLDADDEQRKGFPSIPTDSVNNQLMYWIVFSKNAGISAKSEMHENALLKNPAAQISDFETKYVLNADGRAKYDHARKVIETFRDLELNNLNFITSLEGSDEE